MNIGKQIKTTDQVAQEEAEFASLPGKRAVAWFGKKNITWKLFAVQHRRYWILKKAVCFLKEDTTLMSIRTCYFCKTPVNGFDAALLDSSIA